MARRPPGTGSLYRPSFRDRHGKLRKGRVWWMAWLGAKPQSTGCTDKNEAEMVLREHLRARDLHLTPVREVYLQDIPSDEIVARLRALRLTGSDVSTLRGPLVYVWRRNGTVLYVGKGESGIGRPLARHHHRLVAIQQEDLLEIIPCASRQAAVKLEGHLISRLNPELNRDPGPRSHLP